MVIPSVFGLQGMLIAAGAAFVVGSCAGAGGMHAYYSPRLELCENQKKDLGEKLGSQNWGIDKAIDASKKRAAKAKAALKASEQSRLDAEGKAALLEASIASAPASPPERCAAASALMRKELGQ